MQKVQHFKGKIFFYEDTRATKKELMAYEANPAQVGFEQTMMSAFDFLNLTAEEKKQLSKKHRDLLSSYHQINPFMLNADAHTFVEEVTQCKGKKIRIEAHAYGAYICLAALYSGKLPADKTFEFVFEKAPLALFPKTLVKGSSDYRHKIIMQVSDDCWLKPFSTLCHHDKIKFSLKAA